MESKEQSKSLSETQKPWYGFDLDGTLAEYHGWQGIQHIGKPIKSICKLAINLHKMGKEVKVVTARVSYRFQHGKEYGEEFIVDENGKRHYASDYIKEWCENYLGFIPEITDKKDYLMLWLVDDRTVQVEPNTGLVLGQLPEEMISSSRPPKDWNQYPDWSKICPKCAEDGHDGLPWCEYYGEPNGCNSPTYLVHPKTEPAGNALILREACKAAEEYIYRLMVTNYTDEAAKIQDILMQALRAPMRNCDLHFADIDEAMDKFTYETTIYDVEHAFKWMMLPGWCKGKKQKRFGRQE
jgi:hypothetical protein